MEVIGKRDLAWAGTQSETLRRSWEAHLHEIIASQLEQRP
jgi:hypothetical protein